MNELLKSKTFTIFEKAYVFDTILNNSKEKKTQIECLKRLTSLVQSIIDDYLIPDDIKTLLEDKMTSAISHHFITCAVKVSNLFDVSEFVFKKNIKDEKVLDNPIIHLNITIPECALKDSKFILSGSTDRYTWYMNDLIISLKGEAVISDLKDIMLDYLESSYNVKNFGGEKIFGSTWTRYIKKPFDSVKTWGTFEKLFPEYIDILTDSDNAAIKGEMESWIQSHKREKDYEIKDKLLEIEKLLK